MTGPPATGPRTASSDIPSTGQIDDAATSAATTRIGRSSLFDMIVAQDLCTRTGALLVPKGYRVSERFVARLANFNQGRDRCHLRADVDEHIRWLPDVASSGMPGFGGNPRTVVALGVGELEEMSLRKLNGGEDSAKALARHGWP